MSHCFTPEDKGWKRAQSVILGLGTIANRSSSSNLFHFRNFLHKGVHNSQAMPPPATPSAHPDSIALIVTFPQLRWSANSSQCTSIVDQLVHDHIQGQLQALHRAHKQLLRKCPQHPNETHTFSREAGKDCFGRAIKSKSDANSMMFPCTHCTRVIGAGVWTRHLAKCMGIAGRGRNKSFKYRDKMLICRNGGSSLNSPMYKELSSDDEDFPSLFAPEAPTTHTSQSPSHDDDEFTPTPTGSTSKKSVPKKRKKDPDKPTKPRKPRAPKNPSDSPSKTHVNRFKQNQGEMVRTASESPLAGQGGSLMARVILLMEMLTSVAVRGIISSTCKEEA